MEDNETIDKTLLRFYPAVVRYVGVLIAIYETIIEDLDRPALLTLAGTMMVGSLAVEAYRQK